MGAVTPDTKRAGGRLIGVTARRDNMARRHWACELSLQENTWLSSARKVWGKFGANSKPYQIETN
jgi:hypothetical protein